MDDLEEHAAKCCSHLSKTVRCHVVNMIEILVGLGHDIPSTPKARIPFYKKHGIPEAVYLEYDGEATSKALIRIGNP